MKTARSKSHVSFHSKWTRSYSSRHACHETQRDRQNTVLLVQNETPPADSSTGEWRPNHTWPTPPTEYINLRTLDACVRLSRCPNRLKGQSRPTFNGKGRGAKRKTHLHLVPRLRIRAPPLYTPSWNLA